MAKMNGAITSWNPERAGAELELRSSIMDHITANNSTVWFTLSDLLGDGDLAFNAFLHSMGTLC